MPPRCPECGRFLSREFVQGLLVEPAACPRCEHVLDAASFEGSEAVVTAPEPLAASVRPPDLPPADVIPPSERDVLAGWEDPGSERARDRQGIAAPLGAAAAIVGAGVVGGLVGGLSARRHRSFGAVVGTLAGATAAIVGARLLEVPFTPQR